MRRPPRSPRAATTTVTVTVSREERDALHPELTFGLYGAAPDLASRELAVDFRDRLDLVIGLHDDLGWSSDDGRRRFTLTAEPAVLRRWLTDVRSAAERAVRDEHHLLQELLDDRAAAPAEERAAAAREARAVIDGDLETIHACDAILARLPRQPHAERPQREPRWRRRPAALAARAAAR
ncbi:MAG TPA: hypothetical protein VIL49_03320 [Capillimicrobium sp.]